MRLLFLGSPEFAVPTLRALHGAAHEIALVVTRPDRPRGRGRRPQPTAVKRAARELSLEVFQPRGVNAPGAVDALREARAELGVVVAYGEILSPQLLDVTERGFVNLHASLLPDYRGAAPVNWAVIRGETRTGVTVIRMEPELDAGPMLARVEVEIGPDETAGGLHERLSAVGAEAVADVVGRLDAGVAVPEEPQPRAGGFFARKLTKADGRLDWSLPAEAIRDRVRGLTPWPGAFCEFRGGDRAVRLTLVEAEVAAEAGNGEAGEVAAVEEHGAIVVAAGEGLVRILMLKPAGGREMTAGDFAHGYRVRPGDRFI